MVLQLESKLEHHLWVDTDGDTKPDEPQDDFQTLISHFNTDEPQSLFLGVQSSMHQTRSITSVDSFNNSNQTESGNMFSTGIKIRTRQPQNLPAQLIPAQGTAVRRLRFQKKLQIGPVASSRPVTDFKEQNCEVRSFFLEEQLSS